MALDAGKGIANGEAVITESFIASNDGNALELFTVNVKLVRVKLVVYGIKNSISIVFTGRIVPKASTGSGFTVTTTSKVLATQFPASPEVAVTV